MRAPNFDLSNKQTVTATNAKIDKIENSLILMLDVAMLH